MDRVTRREKILEIIKNVDVETQLELIEQLKIVGLNATQATISRDINQLGLLKVAKPNGGYKYICVEHNKALEYDNKLLTLFKQSVVSIDIASDLIVIRTMSGSANSACFTIDKLNIDGIVGTLAGDDTIFVAVKSADKKEQVFQRLNELLE